MAKRKEHFGKDSDLRVPSKLSADLNALFEPQVGVPPEVDRAVMDRAYTHLAPLQSGKGKRLRIHWGWRIAAAAAVIILAFSLDLTKQTGPATDSFLLGETQAADIDRNGRVDILDAFKLARHIESAGNTETKWDFNGDGLIDRNDVDVVANAAVRLDKGVL
ncbi:MAG: dockerin type I domain-containing protein [Sedimentisphaerales bacterium]